MHTVTKFAHGYPLLCIPLVLGFNYVFFWSSAVEMFVRSFVRSLMLVFRSCV